VPFLGLSLLRRKPRQVAEKIAIHFVCVRVVCVSTMKCLPFLFAALSLVSQSEAICCLCDMNCSPPIRGSFKVNAQGTTCYTLSMQMADPRNAGQCTANQARYRRTCCDPSYNPPAVTQGPPPQASNFGSQIGYGPNPSCDICPGGGYPTANQVLAILYMPGNPTCQQLWHLAKKGYVPQRICNPLQDFCIRVCGCP
jgi:hypothetical protein